MFVGKQSKVAGKLTTAFEVNNCDMEFIWDTRADVSILTEATGDMLGLDLQKPGCQLTSADSSDLNDAGVCNVRISKHIHSVNADIYALRGFQENLLGMFELRQFALNDVSDVQHNRASWLGILGDNEKALKSNATADVKASFMFFCFRFFCRY